MAQQRDLAEQLLRLAREDEAAALALVDVPSVTEAIVGFHAQQAVEKALKAVLAARGVAFPFSHDIAGLVELCEESGRGLPTDLTDVDTLTPYGVRLRYAAMDGPGLVDRAAAQRLAADAIAWAADELRGPA